MRKVRVIWSEEGNSIFVTRRRKVLVEEHHETVGEKGCDYRTMDTPGKGNSNMKDMKIMLVDDEERFLSTTKKLLSKQGYEVITATSGAEAIDLIQHHMVYVVILDVKMPGMDGIATLKEIKKRFPLVEVIMLTGHATVESAVEGLKLGAIDYLIKPTGIEELIKKSEEALEKRTKMEEKIRVAQARIVMKSPR